MQLVGFSQGARRLGVASAVAITLLEAVYAVVLVAGLMSLKSPQDPISDPYFTLLELLIIAIAPLAVALMSAVHAWAAPDLEIWSLLALVLMALLAGVTCSVHFAILTLSRQPAFADLPWMPLFLSFRWPSVVYALDILAWDFFFALSVLFAAPVFSGDRLRLAIRVVLIATGVLALAGLVGVLLGDMQVRLIGVVGYVGVFPVACVLLAVLFHRSKARQ